MAQKLLSYLTVSCLIVFRITSSSADDFHSADGCGDMPCHHFESHPTFEPRDRSGDCVRNVVRAKVGYNHPRNAYEQTQNNVGALYDKIYANWDIIALAAYQCNVDRAIARVIIQDEVQNIQREGLH